MNQLSINQNDYIRKNLEDFAPFLMDELRQSLEKKQLVKTGELKNSLKYTIEDVKGIPVLKVSFEDRGRFLEIRSHRKKSSLAEKMKVQRALYGNITKQKKTKNQMWYTRRTWGVVYHVLIPQIMFDLKGLISESFSNISK